MSILNEFDLEIVGGGAVVQVGGGGFRCSASGADAARARRNFPAIPGTTYKASFQARVVSGSGGTRPFSGIDYPTLGAPVDSLAIGDDWATYTMGVTVPFDANPVGSVVSFAFGVFAATEGVVEYADIKFSQDNGPFNMTETFIGVQLYTAPGGATVNATANVDLARSGDVVVLTARATINGSLGTADMALPEDFLPTWAEANQKATQFSEFDTGGNTFTACDVANESFGERDVLFFQRSIGSTGISDENFVAGEKGFSISYVAKGAGR